MKKIKYLIEILVVLLLLSLLSCGTTKETTTETTTETSKLEVKQDSSSKEEKEVLQKEVIKFVADSTSLNLLFECDSNNNVLIREIEELESGNRIHQDFNFQNGKLEVTNKVNEDSIIVYWKNYYYKEYLRQIAITADSTYFNKSTEKTVKTIPFFMRIKNYLIGFVIGFIVCFTKKFWLKLFGI
jgi:hypothetical protein